LAKKEAKQTEDKAQERSRVRGSRALWIGFAKNRCEIARGGAQYLSIYNQWLKCGTSGDKNAYSICKGKRGKEQET
jgi:hypothetical protein